MDSSATATQRFCRRLRQGFTLVELLVVITIIGILVGLLLPAIGSAREAARLAQCKNNVKQLSLGIIQYDTANNAMPPSHIGGNTSTQYATWAVLVLPYIDQNALFAQWTMANQYPSQPRSMVQAEPAVFFCPTRRAPMNCNIATDSLGGTCSDYAGCGGSNSTNTDSEAATDDPQYNGIITVATNVTITAGKPVSFTSVVGNGRIPNGASNTLLVGEKHIVNNSFLGMGGVNGDGCPYDHSWPRHVCRLAGSYFPIRGFNDMAQGTAVTTASTSNQDWDRCFGSWHQGVCPFAFADGHVTPLSDNIDLSVLNLLAQYNNYRAIPNY